MMVSVGFAPVPVGKWPAVHHKKVVDLVRLAPLIEHRSFRIVPHARGAVLVRTVAGDPLRIDAVDLFRSGSLQNLRIMVDHPPAHLQVIFVNLVGDTCNRQIPTRP